MKIKHLLLSLGIASIATVSWYVVNEGQEAPAYTPRSDYNKIAAGAEGAFEYYKSIRANVHTGEIEKEDILRVREAINKSPIAQAKNDDVEWVSMGPTNVGGRTRAILPLSSSDNVLIAGGVSGGLFKSTDGAQNWSALGDFDPYLIVSSLAELGNGAIYCATGNSRENAGGQGGSGFIGRGLFYSTDEGNTWELIEETKPSLSSSASDWSNIDVIKADPTDPNKLWVGSNLGLLPFDHETKEFGPTPEGLPDSPANVKDLDIVEQGGQVYMLTAIGSRIYRSLDGGESFEVLTSPVFPGFSVNSPTGTFPGTVELTISRNDPNYMYMSVSQPNGFLRGVYATTDAGTTWYVIAPPSFDGENISQFAPFFNGLTSQGWYDNMITSVPNEENEEVIMGGIRMWRWNLSGVTPGITAWEEVNANFASFPGGPPSPIYVHSDIHTDAWDSQNRLWVGTDGGVFRTTDNGLTWTSLNKDYVTTQYYAIAFNPFGQVLGGLQDNGTLWLSLIEENPGFAQQFTGGDGFDCEISQKFPEFMFSTIYNGALFRSADGGQTAFPLFIASQTGSDFNTDIAIHENEDNELSEVFVEYSPALDSPFIEFFPADSVVLSADGDTIIGKIPANTEIQVQADNNPYLLNYTTTQDVNFYSYYVREFDDEEQIYENVADTIFVQETPQFLLAAALSNGTFVSRDPLKTNGTPQFFQVNGNEGTNPTSVEWSPCGDHLYVGFRDGRLIRLSGFNSAWTEDELTFDEDEYALTKTLIRQGFGAVTDIEVDYSQGQEPDASERVAISIGGYGGSGKILISDQAASVPASGSFADAWNVPDEFEGMPAYSVVMDIENPDILLAGTEYGVWYSDNSGATWTEANNGEMPRVPVFDLRQQKEDPWNVENGGVVYAGTHGRGVFRTDYFLTSTSTEDIADEKPVLDEVMVFPNPVTGEAKVMFDLGTSTDIEMYIYSVEGRLVEAFQEQRVEAGFERQISFDATDYSIGQYILQLRVGDTWKSSKFVVTR